MFYTFHMMNHSYHFSRKKKNYVHDEERLKTSVKSKTRSCPNESCPMNVYTEQHNHYMERWVRDV